MGAGNLTGRSETQTTDSTGAAKFTATQAAGTPLESTGWAYNANGLVTTIVERAQAFGATSSVELTRSTYTYDTSGNATTAKNVIANQTATAKYDLHGKLIEETDTYGTFKKTFSVRGLLVSEQGSSGNTTVVRNLQSFATEVRTTGGLIIKYTYDAGQQVKSITVGNTVLLADSSASEEKKLFDYLIALIPAAHAQTSNPPLPRPGGGGGIWAGLGQIGIRILERYLTSGTIGRPLTEEERCDKCRNPGLMPDWTVYDYNHRVRKPTPWDAVRAGTAPTTTDKFKHKSKYDPAVITGDEIHKNVEQAIWMSGRVIQNTKSKVVKAARFENRMGASNGTDTKCVVVECSGGTIHGRPVDEAECDKPAVPFP